MTPYEAKTASARSAMLSVFFLCAVNCFFMILTDSYFVLAPYFSTVLLGIGMGIYVEEGLLTPYIVLAVIALLVSAIYLLCGLLGKKRIGWLIAGTVLYGLDTLLLVFELIGGYYGGIMDLIIHAIYLTVFITAIVKKTAPAAAAAADGAAPNGDFYNTDGFSAESGTNPDDIDPCATRQVTFNRDKAFYGCGVTYTLTMNGQTIGTLKNGESLTATLPAGNVTVQASYKKGLAKGEGEVIIPAGTTNLSYRLILISGAITVHIEFIKE